MNSISADHLTEEQLTGLLPVWKNQHVMQANLQRAGRGASVISDWISHCVEYKLKKETLNSAQRSLPDLENKINKCMATIAEKTSEATSLELELEKLHGRMEAHGADFDDKFSVADGSVSSLRSTAVIPKGKSEDLPPAEPYVRFVPHSPPSHKKGEFPNFSSDRLYEETPVENREEEFEVDTGESEYCGGCHGKFFCI